MYICLGEKTHLFLFTPYVATFAGKLLGMNQLEHAILYANSGAPVEALDAKGTMFQLLQVATRPCGGRGNSFPMFTKKTIGNSHVFLEMDVALTNLITENN